MNKKEENKEINLLDQDSNFCFWLITYHSIHMYCFCWNEPNAEMHMNLLNTVCGWNFIHDWNDDEYKFPSGKAVIMNDEIRKDIERLRTGFMKNKINEHKQLISSLCNELKPLQNGDAFFIYRMVYSQPSQRLRFKIQNELRFLKQGKTKEEADEWYNPNAASLFEDYNISQFIHAKIGESLKDKRVCRFCGKRMPDTKFEKVAHIVPDSLGGSRNLICYEECDTCNEEFGKGVESNLFKWFEFRRSVNGVSKKSGGIPKGYGRNYVIEDGKINVFADEAGKELKLVGSETVTLQGIYRALCKMSIDVIDCKYLDRLQTTIEWIRFGKPKSSKYPQIAQMSGLPNVVEPQILVFSRKDGADLDNSPFCFCIFRIFDWAALFILPHIDGRMNFPEEYQEGITTEALKLLGYNGEWIWESYDTTEERNPHVIVAVPEEGRKPLDPTDVGPVDKLRKETKPTDSVDFPEPPVIDKNNCSCKIKDVDWKPATDLRTVTGSAKISVSIDMQVHQPLFMRLTIKYKDQSDGKEIAIINGTVTVSPKVVKNQFKIFKDDSLSMNQDLITAVLEYTLNELYAELRNDYPEFPYTREMLEVNNVRELLADLRLRFTKNCRIIHQISGSEIWHTGY